MNVNGKFLPTAGEVGLLPMVTWFFLVLSFYAFVGNAIFALGSRTSVAPEHRSSRLFTAIIAVVAGISHFLIQDYYRDMLRDLAKINSAGTNKIMVMPKLFWGAVSTVGYVVVPVILFQLWRRFREQAQPVEQRAFRLMVLTTVTTWGVYPIGYILTTVDGVDFNWIHLSFSVADVVNKVGVAAVAYLAAKEIVERRVPEEATMPYHQLS